MDQRNQSAAAAPPGQNRTRFGKVMSDPVPIPEAAIERAVAVLRTNRPFRYGEDTAGDGEASQLEAEFARTMGMKYAAAVNSCGCALFLALKSLGVGPGDPVLCNAFTLAPVPGAIAHAGARAVMVDITENLTIDLDHLQTRIAESGAKILLLSHMRGHLADMPALMAICDEAGVSVIEDCAHALGARYDGRLAGSYGRIACFSAQTFKHLNSGEGGLLVTNDAEAAARAIVMSGSYMMYDQSGARPDLSVFEAIRDETPNFSMRMTDAAAALLRPQLPELDGWAHRWNESYRRIEDALATIDGITPIARDPRGFIVGSSIQFLVERGPAGIEAFVADAADHGVFLKWYGAARTKGFTSRFDQWGYGERGAVLAKAPGVLARLIDMRIALTLDAADCDTIGAVIAEAMAATAPLADA